MHKLLSGILSLVLLTVVATPVLATQDEVEKCGATTTFTKEGDYDNSKVNINFQDSDESITVTVKAGYKLTKVELNVENDNQAGFVVYPVVDSVKFNPNPGDDIEVAKVTVEKTCTPVCTDKQANNIGEVVEGQTVEDNTTCTYDSNPYCYKGELMLIPVNVEVPEGATKGECPTPVATPTPKAEPAPLLPNTGAPLFALVGLGVLGTAFGFSLREAKRFFKKG
jgi:hypothetical protein